MALEHQVQLRNDTIVLYVPLYCLTHLNDNGALYRVWISSQHVGAVAQKGFRLIHAASDFFYLDCGGGGWLGNNINGGSSCGVYKTWQKSYSFNPTNGLTGDQVNLVLGGSFLLVTCVIL